MIRVNSVSKRFGAIQALDRVSFEVQEGEIIGLLGPNGAGKTTMLRILSCFTPPSSGEVTIDGLNVRKDSLAIRRRIGYFLEKVSIYPEMRVFEFLKFVAGLKGVKRASRREMVFGAMDACGLIKVKDRIVGNLSKGYTQRVGLAQSLLNDPRILLLDEPTAGLDPEQVVEIRNLIRDLSGKRTVILSSHILPEVSQICGRVIIIDEGRIVAQDTPDELSGSMQKADHIRARIEAPEQDVVRGLEGIQGILSVKTLGDPDQHLADYVIEAHKGFDVPRALCECAFQNKWILREIRPLGMSLEEVFLKLVTKEA